MKPDYPYALPYERYRELMDKDFSRVLELTQSAESSGRLGERVPACPEWDIEQLARHTAMVYLQKAETIRTGVKPQGRWVPEEILQLGAVDILETCYERLTSEFDSHDVSDPAESWVTEDQTVGFWIRRLAHETSIHRYDLEAALGTPLPIEPELAVDGIDEVLTVMVARVPAQPANPDDDGAAPADDANSDMVVIESGGEIWSAALLPHTIAITRQTHASPAGRVTGEPNDVLLWLWGRGPLPAGSAETTAVAELRSRLASST